MARPRYQEGSITVRRGKCGTAFQLRWREDVLKPDGSLARVLRAETLTGISEAKAKKILQAKVSAVNLGKRRPETTMTLSRFVEAEWKPGAALALRKSSVRYYSFQLDRHILPTLGQAPLCDLTRARVEACLSDLKRNGCGNATMRGVRATLSTVLQTAVERQFLEGNPAHGIRIRETDIVRPRRFYSPDQVRKLLPVLPEPCRTIVLLAVLAGMRIGEVLALRWSRVDLARGTIEIAATFSDGEFGPPKTRSSCRVLPISSPLQQALEVHQRRAVRSRPEDLLFRTWKGTPLNAKNLYNRILAPACDSIGEPRVSWHSFRHTHATLLSEAASLKTAQALLGHSDLETTLNTYMHAIPDSQRLAVERVGDVFKNDVLFADVRKEEKTARPN